MTDKQIIWKKIPLIEAVDYEQPNPYIITTKIKEAGKYPVLTPGKSFIKGYTDEVDKVYKDLPVIIFDDFTTASKYVDFDFKVKSSAMKVLKNKTSSINLKFVFYQMKLIKINASTHKRYYISKYQHLHFLFPFIGDSIDIDTQKLLVDEIETQFTRLGSVIKSLNTIKKKLDIYRKSVLKAAFEGNFTNDECKKTIDILGFQLRMPKSWNIGKLSDLGDYSRGKSKHRPRNDQMLYKNGKYPFIQTGEISNANRLIKSYRKMYNDTGLKQSKLWPKGTLCITIAANIAKTAILDFDACFPDSVIGFNSKTEKTILFVMYYIQLLQQILDIKASATAQKNINIGTFERMSFPVLDDDLQEQIVDKIESRFSVIDKIEQTINKALIKAEQLRKSILKSAFEGRLVNYPEGYQ